MAAGKHSPGFEALVTSVMPSVHEIPIEDVRRKLAAAEPFELVDVREESEYAVDRLPGARHLGRGVLERDVETTIPDPATEIVLYCGGGFRSALAAEHLQRMGYRRVLSMAGGIRAWREAGLPLEAPGTGNRPTVAPRPLEALRTPEYRFANLPGWSFAPHYVEVGGLRIHYVDEGAPSAPVVLLLHGEPSWSYLYRKMIPVLVDAGLRAVAPDLVGFGRSDKPVKREDYTYECHVAWMRGVLEALDLRGITLVGQDWGGLVGLRLVAENAERFARIVAANTFLPTGDEPANPAFEKWRTFSQEVPTFPVGRIVSGGCATALDEAVVAAYDAPFPDERYKAGARQFPTLVPTRPDDPAAEANRRAWGILEGWTKPVLTAFSDGDPITRGGDPALQRRIPGARGEAHVTIRGGGHFLQEDRGGELARVVAEFIRRHA